MLEVQKFLKNHSLDELKQKYGIENNVYKDRIVLNYSQINSSGHKCHDIVRECRALILRLNDYEILSRSFDRFYNYGEDPKSKKFDITKSSCDEKLDGSLINIYHDGKEWCASTRKMAFAEGENSFGVSFYNMVVEAIEQDLESFMINADISNTYIFELTSPMNRVVKSYSNTSLTLLAVRDKFTGDYYNRDDCFNYSFAGKKVNLPINYKFNSIDEIMASIKTLPALDEGYVCCIGDWRIKIKNPSYLAVAHLHNNGVMSPKRVIFLIIANDHEEYLLNFPEDTPLFNKYINVYSQILEDIKNEYNKYKIIKSDKDFALAIQNVKVNHILFAIRRGKTLEEVIDKMTDSAKVRLFNLYLEEKIDENDGV